MDKAIVEFGKRMNKSEDKSLLIDYAEGFKEVLDLGAGTGKISRDIAEKWGAHCDAVDLQFKEEVENSENVTYYGMDIIRFLRESKKKYDLIILSAILHELNDSELVEIFNYLPYVMNTNCRVIIREPFYDSVLGPIKEEDANKFSNLVKDHLPAGKAIEFFTTRKLHNGCYGMLGHYLPNRSALEWLNLCFTLSYGEDSWYREKYELRYARSLDWVKEGFNFKKRPYTGFQVYPILDKTYKEHFTKINIPEEAFDLIQYTGMIIVIDYSIND